MVKFNLSAAARRKVLLLEHSHRRHHFGAGGDAPVRTRHRPEERQGRAYEIAAYGCVPTYADLLSEDTAADYSPMFWFTVMDVWYAAQ